MVLHINDINRFAGFEGYNKKVLNLKCKGKNIVLGLNVDLESSIHECTIREKCKAVLDYGCTGQNFHLCGEVEINRGISSGCVYQKSKYATQKNKYMKFGL